jgi:hypothetical protein
MSDDSFLGQRLVSVLGVCELTFDVLVSRLLVFNGSLKNETGNLSRRGKLERLWNESNIAELGQNISRLSDGLNLLLTALNMYEYQIYAAINLFANTWQEIPTRNSANSYKQPSKHYIRACCRRRQLNLSFWLPSIPNHSR